MEYISKAFPELQDKVSHNPSPMVAIAKYIKSTDPTGKVVFIGPCTAKKNEFRKESVRPWVDSVLTFEELQALFDSRDLEISTLPEDVLDNASYYGRICARSGGLSEAVAQAFSEKGSDFQAKPVVCSGIEEWVHGVVISQEVGMPVQVADAPLDCVAIGTGQIVEGMDTLKKHYSKA